MFSLFKKKPATIDNALAEFMRNGSAREHKRVFKKVIEESIKDQQKIIERAAQIRAERRKKQEMDADCLSHKAG